MFRYLDRSSEGTLSEEDFDHVYDAVMLSWEPQSSSAPWFRTAWEPLQRVLQVTHDIMQWKRMEDIISKFKKPMQAHWKSPEWIKLLALSLRFFLKL